MQSSMDLKAKEHNFFVQQNLSYYPIMVESTIWGGGGGFLSAQWKLDIYMAFMPLKILSLSLLLH